MGERLGGSRIDPYLIYLLVVNALVFLLLMIDYHACMRMGREGLIDHRIHGAFAFIGGGVGMLGVFLIWGRRVNKNNVAWRLTAIIGIAMWSFVTLCAHGVVRLDAAFLLAPLDLGHLASMGVYLLVVNLVTFALFIYDKLQAEQGWIDKRIPEIALFGFSLVGGAVGASRGCVS